MCSVGDVPEGISIYVVENEHVRDQVGVIARYEPAPDLRSGMVILTNLRSGRVYFPSGTIYATAMWFCPGGNKGKKGLGQPAPQPE